MQKAQYYSTAATVFTVFKAMIVELEFLTFNLCILLVGHCIGRRSQGRTDVEANHRIIPII